MRKNKLETLRAERKQKIEAMRATLDKSEPTEAELAEYDETKAQVDRLNERIAREEDLQVQEANLAEPEGSVGEGALLGTASRVHRGPEAAREFDGMGEFMHAVRFRPNDQRLTYVEPGLRGEQRMDQGSTGGFAVPNQLLNEFMQVPVPAAIVRPRARVIPAGSPPDAAISFPALDQNNVDSDIYGGVSISWIGEGGEKPDTSAKIREITLQPHEVAGSMVVTDKLLRNWAAASAILTQLLRAAQVHAEERKFLAGTGVAQPLGFLGHASQIAVNRQVANRISYTDVTTMESRLLSSSDGVWLTTRRAVQQLRTMVDAAGQYVWSDAAAGAPPMLLGKPVIIDPRVPQLGSKGDLMLVDLSHYLIKDGSGPYVAASEHVHFTANKTVFKIFWNVDGKPWLTTPIEQPNGDTESPFVVLDVP